MDLDNLYTAIGLTKYQLLTILLLQVSLIPTLMTFSIGAYLSAVPEHRCRTPLDDIFSNITDGNFSLTSGSCDRYDYNYTNCNQTACLLEQGEVGTIPCDNGWIYSKQYYEETTISKWDLVCKRRTLDSTANALFSVGILLGSAISGFAINLLGRKKAMVISILCVGFFTVIQTLVPWFELYVFCRTMASAALITANLSGFTLTSEILPKRWRATSSIINGIIYALSSSMVPLFAWIFRDWTKYILLIGCLVFPLTIFAIFIPESPRWLLLNSKEFDAKQILKKIYRSSGVKLNDKQWEEVVETEKDKMTKSKESNEARLTYLDLFRYPMTRLVILNFMYTWFVVAMIYSGLILNITNFAGNPYINGTLNSLVGIISTLAFYSVDVFGRRRVLSFSFTATSLCCVTSMLLKTNSNGRQGFETGAVAAAITGKLFANLVFDLAYLMTAETFPTSLRSLAMGITSMGGRIGGIVAPYALQLQYEIPWLTQTIFSILALIAGLAALLYPETRDMDLAMTIEEGEKRFIKTMPKTAALFNGRKIANDPKNNVLVNEHASDAAVI